MVAAFVWLRRRAAARTDRLEAAFPVAVRAMSDTVQAGGNVQQALARACDESSSPMREELQRAIDELSVGVPVDDVLGSFARRCSVPGADVLAVALTSAVRSGADVRPVLECIVDAAVDRRRLRRELRAATAQGRMTALVIGSLPAAFLLVMGAGGGSELRFLFHEPAGVVLVAAGACLEALGFAWMRRLGRAR
jgi:tight adherence protein B